MANTTAAASMPLLLPEAVARFAGSWSSYLLPAIVAYPLLCAALRFHRLHSLQARFPYGTPAHPSYEGMTLQEAHDIVDAVSEQEFPALYEKGIQFALFRTYGIPSISRLLVQTRQLSAAQLVPKRYADTAVLLTDMYAAAPDSERCHAAYARLNFLHGHYIRQGLISNDNMLYTLSLFLNQPVEWIQRYEWRSLSPLEMCAMGVVHKAMGDGMNISLAPLPSSTTGWKDGLHFYRELDAWAKEYERRHMVPDARNFDTAVQTRNLLLATVPRFLHGLLIKFVSVPLDERLRAAVMFEPAPWACVAVFTLFMEARRFVLRHLALPRPSFMRQRPYATEDVDQQGRRYIQRWDTMPVYVKPTVWNRWGPSGLASWCLGIPRPGDAGMYGDGFEIETVGPSIFRGKGAEEMEREKQRLRRERTPRCPFSGPQSQSVVQSQG